MDHKEKFEAWAKENRTEENAAAIDELLTEPVSEFARKYHLSPEERVDAILAIQRLRAKSEPIPGTDNRVFKPEFRK